MCNSYYGDGSVGGTCVLSYLVIISEGIRSDVVASPPLSVPASLNCYNQVVILPSLKSGYTRCCDHLVK